MTARADAADDKAPAAPAAEVISAPAPTVPSSVAPTEAPPPSPVSAVPPGSVPPASVPPSPAPVAPAPIPVRALGPPRTRFVINNMLIGRYNGLGFEDQIRMGFQFLLYRSASPVLRDNFFFVGIHPKINPAYVKVGPSVELQPTSFFNLKIGAEWMGFFKTFGYLQSFQSPLDSYSDTLLAAGKDHNANYSTSGIHLMFEPVLQFRAPVRNRGFFAIKNKLSVEYWNMTLHAGDPLNAGRLDSVWYDATLDTLVPSNGWVVQDDLDLAFITNVRLTVGVRYSAVIPFYAPTDFRSAAEAAQYTRQNSFQRVGPVLAYTFFDHGYTSFNKPTLLFIAGWYLEHRYRTGADTPEALPYMVLAFSFQSDLMK